MAAATTDAQKRAAETTEESAAKRPCPSAKSPWQQLLGEKAAEALAKHSREDMMRGVFDRWDRDGSGEVDFEELLPHYMKARNQVEKDEPEVRAKFHKYLASKGKDPSKGGLSFELFRGWLAAASDEQIATQYAVAVQGVTQEPFSMNVDLAVIKAYEGKSLKEILDAPTSAIQGISESMADILKELDVSTVRDLGHWKFFLLARAIVVLADKEMHHSSRASHGLMNIRHALDRAYESKTLQQVSQLHPSAFNMFSEKAGSLLAKLNITTIQQLGTRKMFAWANAMADLEKFEALT